MRQTPILFNAEMVNAILASRKTQTRRMIKPQPWKDGEEYLSPRLDKGYYHEDLNEWWFVPNDIEESDPSPSHCMNLKCPYGKPGDLLWVKETRWRNGGYVATDSSNFPNEGKIPSIYMPRFHSRIKLEITDVRVERVQDISWVDSRNEGIFIPRLGIRSHRNRKMIEFKKRKYVDLFHSLWDSINIKRCFGWADNPWVWVIEFKEV